MLFGCFCYHLIGDVFAKIRAGNNKAFIRQKHKNISARKAVIYPVNRFVVKAFADIAKSTLIILPHSEKSAQAAVKIFRGRSIGRYYIGINMKIF